ncbi:unnamed protein product [Diamesa hyperborea]
MTDLVECEANIKVQNFIDAYPEDVLLKIFELLDSKTIENLTLVNKRWRGIVTNSSKIMKKLPLVIRADILRPTPLIVGKWKFYKVYFISIEKKYNKKLPSLKSIGKNIREIEFVHCSGMKLQVLQNILKFFPKVEKLTFHTSRFRDRFKAGDKNTVIELKYLKELVIKQNCLRVLSCIGAQLKSLKINIASKNHAVYFDEHQLMEFLYTQKQLKTLALRTIICSSLVFAENEKAKFEFKLKELSLRNINYDETADDDNLKDFLFTQKDSVEILQLGNTFSKFSNDVFELILNEFDHIKVFRMDVSAFPTNLSFYQKIQVNNKLTKLIVHGETTKKVLFCTILSLFPNVTDIYFIAQIPSRVLSHLTTCCTAITTLSLNSFSPGKYKRIIFPVLKKFHLENLSDITEWSDFVLANRTIESLSFGTTTYKAFFPEKPLCQRVRIVCELLPNLKHLKLGYNMRVEENYLRTIAENCKKLLSIDVKGDQLDVALMPLRKGFVLRCHDISNINCMFPNHEPVMNDDFMIYENTEIFEKEYRYNDGDHKMPN